jgi:ribonuclease HI
LKEVGSLSAKAPQVINEITFNSEVAWGFFDGTNQGSPGIYGARVILYLNAGHYDFKYGAHLGSNNRAEFYALWILLKAAVEKGLDKLQVMGHSKLLMDWTSGTSRIQNLALISIMDMVNEV